MTDSTVGSKNRLSPYMSAPAAWAFSLGTSIGWGSLVITSNTYLAHAGPMGSVMGIIIGGLIMIVISRCYHYLMNRYPYAGGVYSYAREILSYDHGFFVAWFLTLTYLAILCANATSLPLFARYFLGDFFRVGHLYRLFGYEVYLGEAVLSAAAVGLTAAMCSRFKELASKLMVVTAIVFTVGIVVCFLGAARGNYTRGVTYQPYFVPDKGMVGQVIGIACISPWAFIGFENISHFTEEFKFSRTKSFRILTVAVISSTLLYVFVTLLSVTAYPPEYSSWLDYIGDLGNLEGIKGLPAFYAAEHYMGSAGLLTLIIALFGLILSSLIGNLTALSRLFYALAEDGIIPTRFSDVNSDGVPQKALMLVAGLVVPISFLGRTAIGWIVDVTTIGATITYGFVSIMAVKAAKHDGKTHELIVGAVGILIMVGFLLYMMIPNLFLSGSMATESYFLFTAWSALGFLFFRSTLKRDTARRFGKSLVVWIGMLSLILFSSMVWMAQYNRESSERTVEEIREFYTEDLSEERREEEAEFISEQLEHFHMTSALSISAVIVLFAFSVIIMMTNYNIMSSRTKESEEALGRVRDKANRDALTGVFSKHAYIEAENIANDQISSGEAEPFAIIVCDLNGLKYINDTFGHKRGDEYIRAASALLRDLFIHSDVYRIGGDEFAILLKFDDYDNRVEKIRELNSISEANIGTEKVVMSAGLAEYQPEQDVVFREVFDRADAEMYKRKKELKALGARSR